MPRTSLYSDSLNQPTRDRVLAELAQKKNASRSSLPEIRAALERLSSTATTLRASTNSPTTEVWTPPRSVAELTDILERARAVGPGEETLAYRLLAPELKRAQDAENFKKASGGSQVLKKFFK
jgi:hypothetical protein